VLVGVGLAYDVFTGQPCGRSPSCDRGLSGIHTTKGRNMKHDTTPDTEFLTTRGIDPDGPVARGRGYAWVTCPDESTRPLP
jgi:hypothetical protein